MKIDEPVFLFRENLQISTVLEFRSEIQAKRIDFSKKRAYNFKAKLVLSAQDVVNYPRDDLK